jgi:hypothetical protein
MWTDFGGTSRVCTSPRNESLRREPVCRHDLPSVRNFADKGLLNSWVASTGKGMRQYVYN